MRLVTALLIAAAWQGAAQTPASEFERAVAALNAGDYAAAEAGFRHVLAASPHHIPSLQNLGLVYSRTNRVDEAIATYREALAARPQDPGLLANLGLAYLKKQAYIDAMPVFQKLVAVNPGAASARDPELLYLLAQGYAKQVKTAAAASTVAALLAAVSPATAAFVSCKLDFDAGRFEQAVVECRRTLEADATFPGLRRELGKALVSLHSPDAAKELTAAVSQDRNDSVAVYYLGVALLQDGSVEQAVPHLEKAIRLDPKFWGSYYYLGKAKLQIHQAEQAVPPLRQAVALNANAAVAFYELGRALIATGQNAEAEQAMQRVKQLRELDVARDVEILRRR